MRDGGVEEEADGHQLGLAQTIALTNLLILLSECLRNLHWLVVSESDRRAGEVVFWLHSDKRDVKFISSTV